MRGHEIDAERGEQIVHLVRALGRHRYVSGRLHLLHAFAVDAAHVPAGDSILAAAKHWASSVIADPDVDCASKDERLHRRATDPELVAVLDAFWGESERVERSRRALSEHLAGCASYAPDGASLPFDEAAEPDIFPLLVDAGWELLSLSELDGERHKGAIEAFGGALAFDVAKFEEEAEASRTVTLLELPALGPRELLGALDEAGRLSAPFVVWVNGDATYTDYVLRGVRRAAKIDERSPERSPKT